MRRLFITTTALSVALTSGGPMPLMAQTVLQVGDQEVICLQDAAEPCPEGAFCVVAKRPRNCEARALEALGQAATPEEGDAAAATEEGASEPAPAEDAAAAEAEAAALAEAMAAEEAEAAAQAEADAAAQAAADAEAQAAADAAAQAEADAAAQAATDAEAQAAADAAAQAEADAAAQAATDAEAQAAADAAAQAEADAAAQAEADAAAQAATDAEAQAAAEAAAQAEADAAAQAATDAEAQAAAEAAAQAEADAAAQAAADAEAQAAADAEAQAEADAAAQAEAEAPVATEAETAEAPVAEEIAPVTEAEVADLTETAEGVEAPTAAAVTALTDILAAEPAEATGEAEALPEAALAAAAEAAGEVDPAAEAEAEADAAATAEKAPAEPRKRRKPRAVLTEVTEEDTRSSDQDFDGAAIAETTARDSDGKKRLSDLEKFGLVVVGALVVGALLKNGDRVVSNTGDRVIVEQPDGRYVVLKDDDTLIRRPGSTVQTETFDDGSTRSSVLYADGSRIVTIRDAAGRVLQRSRIDARGQETLLINDLAPVERIDIATLPKPREGGMVISTSNQDAELRAALLAEDAAKIGRTFSLRQIREYAEVRALAPTIDVESITFETGSAAIRGSEARKLSELGRFLSDMIAQNPAEMFLIEGHTDAVGSGAYNLALSDRRAESLALALTEYFDVPPENMIVQGYGETELLVASGGDEARNRRAAVRIISPLLGRVTASR